MTAIVHIDGDNFFVSCEILARPDLKGKPVITGGERGIASAMNIEAKKLGITRGMSVYKIKKYFPQVVILPSNFGLYQVYNKRMLSIASRYSDKIEDYSIDECFVDITNEAETWEEQIQIARSLKKALKEELGLTFSLGLAPTKVLAKVASKNKKPDGFTAMKQEDIKNFLKDLDIEDIWGIGRKMSESFRGVGIRTALQFIEREEEYIKRYYSAPYQTLWHELQGVSLMKIETEHGRQKSIQSTRTFPENSNNKEYVFSHLSRDVEIACERLRKAGLYTKKVSIFLKDKDLQICAKDIELTDYTNYSHSIGNEIRNAFDHLFKKNILYRATGITCHGLIEKTDMPMKLFGDPFTKDNLYKALDTLNAKFGDHTLVFAGSMNATKSFQFNQNKINIREKMLPLSFMGEVS